MSVQPIVLQVRLSYKRVLSELSGRGSFCANEAFFRRTYATPN